MSDQTSIDLRGARSGDEDAFARLFERLYPLLHTWARLRVRGALARFVDPEDVIQEVWWRALEALATYDESRGTFRPWLLGIASNVIRDLIRKRTGLRDGGRTRMADADEDLLDHREAQLTSITVRARRNERIEELVTLAMALDEADRQLLVHHGIERVSAREVGLMLGLEENAVAQRWRRLRKRLADGPLWKLLSED